VKVQKQKKLTEQSLVIDIGTASGSAGITRTGKHYTPELSHLVHVPIGSGSETAREALLSHLDEACKTLLEQFAKETVKRVHVVVSAPWHEARIKTITSHTDKAVVISEKTVLKAIQQYKDEKPALTGNKDAEAVAMQVKVHGYSTYLKKPVSGKDLEVNFFESEVVSDVETTITKHVQKVFPHAVISFHTFPLVSSVALRSLSEETSFTIVDVAGEVTEVSIVYEDGLRHLASFPTGYNTIARTMVETKSTLADIHSRLSLYARNELSDTEQDQFEKKFISAFAEWIKEFDATMKSACEAVPIPQKLFLISDKESLGWLKKGIESSNNFSVTVTPVGAPMIQNHLELGEGATYDVFLSLSTLFFHTYKQALIGEV